MSVAEHDAYVRTEMLPPSEPPVSQSGVVLWVRENLFSGPLNTFLTLGSLFVVYQILSSLLPWLFNATWVAGSRMECLELNTGACFAVISDRWRQMLFGFYPLDGIWRPILAFFLLFVALAPILATAVPRRLLLFSVIYPGLMVWLLWGGSLWGPISVYVGIAVVYLIARFVALRSGTLAASVVAVLAFALLFMDPLTMLLNMAESIFGFFSGAVYDFDLKFGNWRLSDIFPLIGHGRSFIDTAIPLDLTPVESRNFGGFMLSFVIGVTGIALSLPFGILLALGRRSDYLLVKMICVGFIEFIRGVPLITLLLVASTLLNIFMPPGTNFDIILRVIIMVTLFSSAYMAETIRGGLAAIPRGQFEAADALGLDYWKAQRLIVMPQALKISIPGIVNNFIGLFKDTTLVSIIGLLDPVGFSKAIRADADWNGIVWELYGFIGFVFFVCCFSMSRYSQYLERKLRTTH